MTDDLIAIAIPGGHLGSLLVNGVDCPGAPVTVAVTYAEQEVSALDFDYAGQISLPIPQVTVEATWTVTPRSADANVMTMRTTVLDVLRAAHREAGITQDVTEDVISRFAAMLSR